MKEKIIYLNSGKCAWGKCIFCGWGKYDYPKMSMHDLKHILDEKLRDVKFGKLEQLKIFNSGSFLDEQQIPKAFRSYVVRKCEQLGIKNLVIESRGEFVDEKFANDMKSEKVKVTIGIGLEVADNEILKKLNKGITVEDYIRTAEFLRSNGFGVRTYLLVNAPYTNKERLKKSVDLALQYSDSICLLNWFPHGYSEAFELWLEGKWKPLTRSEFEEMTSQFKDPRIEKYFEEFVFVPKFTREKQTWIKGATEKELLHPYYEVWQDYICRFYKQPKSKNVVLFIPCTFTKPYFKSRLHRKILKIAPKNLHLVVISSPGVIPYEFVGKYPFNRYDWPEWLETKEIKKLYIKITEQRIKNYLSSHNYKKYFCYLKPTSESFQALKQACTKLNIKITDCLTAETWEKIKNEKNPLALPEALKDLKIV